jgi:hypothetical protein
VATNDDFGQGVSIASLTDVPNAEVLAKNIANALAGRSVMRFTSASARTAALTGPSAPVEGMVSSLGDTDMLYRYNGSAWRLVAPFQQTGLSTVSFTNKESFTVDITFPIAYSTAPRVFTNIAAGAGSTARWGSRAIEVTTSGFSLFLFSGDADTVSWSAIPVHWTAVAS